MVIQTFFLIFLGLSEKFPKTSKWFNDLASHPTYKYAVELLYPGDPKKLLQVSASVRGDYYHCQELSFLDAIFIKNGQL